MRSKKYGQKNIFADNNKYEGKGKIKSVGGGKTKAKKSKSGSGVGSGSSGLAGSMAGGDGTAVRRKGFRNWKTWQKVALILIIVILVGAAAGYAYINSKLNKVQKATLDTKKLSCVDVNGYVNIALLGVDSRSMDKSHLKGHNTDAIIIVSMNTKNKKVNLISVYRDTYTEIGETGSYNKINSAYASGGATTADRKSVV